MSDVLIPKQLRHNPENSRWDFLKGAFPVANVNPTDVDLAYTYRGQFLFMEGKRPGQRIPRGQHHFFDELDKFPEFTIIHFEGHQPDDVHRFTKWNSSVWIPGDAWAVRALVAQWKDVVDERLG